MTTADLNQYAQPDFKANKRRKISTAIVNKDKFAPGAIMKVKVHDFVVYASTEFVLSPSLNMIIAPNGTGKSTFVCAVCLGLGGHPQLLGRQKVVSEFVRNGQQSATIEITLKNKGDERDVVIKRVIYLTNKSDWSVNGSSTSEAKVKAMLLGLNVQLDNLCQFLPQEKVADFSKLSQEALLLETQRAVDVNMLNQHQALIEFDDQKVKLDAELSSKMSDKAHLEEEKLRYEEEARKYEAFQKKKLEIEDHKKLLPYAEIQDIKREGEKLKQSRDEIKAELDAYNAEMAPFQDAIDDIESKAQVVLNAARDKDASLQKIHDKLEAQKTEVEKADGTFEQIAERISQLEQRAQTKRNQLADVRKNLQAEESKLATIQPIDEELLKDYTNNADKLHIEGAEFEDRISDLNTKNNQLQRAQEKTNNQIRSLHNQLSSKDKLHLLDRMKHNRIAQESKKVVELLRSELSDMSGDLFEPPLITVTATDEDTAAYLEEVADLKTGLAITAVSKAAFDRHSKRLIEEKRTNAPMRYLSGNYLAPKMTTEQLRSYGFEGYLRDFVRGPDAVVQMLSETIFIHDIPVSRTPLTDQQIDRLRRGENGQLIFRKFFSGKTMYSLNQSRYGSQQVTVKAQEVSGTHKNYTNAGLSEDDRRRIQENIQRAEREVVEYTEEIANYRKQIHVIKGDLERSQQQLAVYNKHIKDANAIRKVMKKHQERIKLYNEPIQKLEVEANKDHSGEILTHQKRMKQAAIGKIKAICAVAELQSDYNLQSQELTQLKIISFEEEARAIVIKDLFQSIQLKRKDLEQQLNLAKRKMQELKNSDRRRYLQDIVSTYTEDERNRLVDLIQEYRDSERFTVAIINEIIYGLDGELAMLGNSTKSSVTTLEKITNALDVLNGEIPALELEIKTKSKMMTDIYREWEPKLMEMVQKISAKFSTIFPSVGSAGEICVGRAERFKDWKMEIMVKFRENSELKALDSHTQSGGERAVSTVYYMISMQELTVSPFRVVDEINQGMDARNERIVHKNMVEIACQEHTSQYFLITPKLLTNLHYAENMRIHCIMAGPWTPDPIKNPEMLALGTTSLYITV